MTDGLAGEPTPTGSGDRPAAAGTRPAFLPSEVDPTVFDEAFLRQLERLLLLMRSPVRGGLKGGRRSVKRGQSVEFADYRDYTLGDDLRQLDWNVYARLEKLFVKLFVEEEDVTVTLLVDASASMAAGVPAKLLFAKRAAAALGYIGLASEDRVAVTALSGRTARRRTALRGSGPRLPAPGRPVGHRAADGPTDLLAAARHAAAQLHGRGVVILLSDLLDPSADRVIRELAATGSELIVLHILSPDELDPALEGDLRLVDSETGEGLDVTVDLATIDAYKARLAAWKAGFADLAAKRGRQLRRPVVGRQPRRPHVRRAAPPPGPGLGHAVHHPARAGRPDLHPRRHRDVHAQAAARPGRRPLDAPVEPPPDRRRGERAVAAPAPEPAPAPATAPGASPWSCSRHGRSWSDRPDSPATSSWSSTPRPAWPPPTSPRTGSPRRAPRRSTPSRTCRRAAG